MSETAVAAADAGNLEAFVKALQEQKKKNKDGDDDMNVDWIDKCLIYACMDFFCSILSIGCSWE